MGLGIGWEQRSGIFAVWRVGVPIPSSLASRSADSADCNGWQRGVKRGVTPWHGWQRDRARAWGRWRVCPKIKNPLGRVMGALSPTDLARCSLSISQRGGAEGVRPRYWPLWSWILGCWCGSWCGWGAPRPSPVAKELASNRFLGPGLQGSPTLSPWPGGRRHG